MFARGLITKYGKRLLVLATIALLFAPTSVQADSLNLKYQGHNDGPGLSYTLHGTSQGTVNGSTNPGTFNWNVRNDLTSNIGGNQGINQVNTPSLSTALGSNNTPVTSFCIELREYIYDTTNVVNYTLVKDLSGLPKASLPNPMGPTAAHQLQVLADLLDNAGFISAGYTNGQLQAAIWEIVYGANLDPYSGANGAAYNTAVSGILSAITLADITYNANSASQFFVGLDNIGIQDQITLVSPGTYNSIPPVPAPAGVVLAGMAFACVGGYNLLRRRKAIAAV
ncbi:MAG: hypothetical protein U0796_09840 [Gemmatales bacterium]